jgi:DNA mismatch repair protein MutS2
LGALKIFAHETPGVENGSMEFNRETLQPTYHFRLGIPGSSYASEIAKRWGLPDAIIERARELVGSKKNRFENLLEDLESRLQKYRSLSEAASIKQTELDGLIRLYRQKYDEISSNEKKLKKKAIEESDQIVQEANKAIEQAIKKIREEQASREAIKTAHELINQEKEKIRQERKHIEKTPIETPLPRKSIEKATIGAEVFWVDYQLNGTILSEPDAEGRVLIQTDGMKVKVSIKDLTSASGKKQKIDISDVKVTFQKSMSNELDLRGYRVEEALIEVDKFLDEAILSGLNEVYIIHGKGTGALMKAIHEFLDRHRRVKSKGFPKWNLGDTGMTVVELG